MRLEVCHHYEFFQPFQNLLFLLICISRLYSGDGSFMAFSLISLISVILLLNVIVIVHEFGHYIMAKRAGMKILVFSVGFGKPIFWWTIGGVKWQVCFIMFGGYVKIAGMDDKDGDDSKNVEGGFYSKGPWATIKVAAMGPMANIFLSAVLFSVVWFMGGRARPFSEFTNVIGWVDTDSELYKMGVKPGDTIETYNHRPFAGFKDVMYNGVLKADSIEISGEKMDYINGASSPYKYDLATYQSPNFPDGMKVVGVTSPASVVVFSGFDEKKGEKSPLYNSGIAPGDRIVWAGGEPIFSTMQLNRVVNQQTVVLTVDRGGQNILVKVPRVSMSELQLTKDQEDELNDWRRALGIKTQIKDLFFIPYDMNVLGYINGSIPYVDNDLVDTVNKYSTKTLNVGDRVIAVNGEMIDSGMQMFEKLDKSRLPVIVQSGSDTSTVAFKDQPKYFDKEINWKALHDITSSMGTSVNLPQTENIKMLSLITPITQDEFAVEKDSHVGMIPQATSSTTTQNRDKRIFLGAKVHEQAIKYNPSPISVIKDGSKETLSSFKALILGDISPKFFSGTVGVVKVAHDCFASGILEVLYLMGLISLNLGILNLLPIPVLDGGHICLSLWEMITKKRIKSKTLERLIIPFMILIIGFLAYMTFQDIYRIFFNS